MLDQIEELGATAREELNAVSSLDDLEAWRVRYLGRKSSLVDILRSLSKIPIEERKQVGGRANAIKRSLEEQYEVRKADLENQTIQPGQGQSRLSLLPAV